MTPPLLLQTHFGVYKQCTTFVLPRTINPRITTAHGLPTSLSSSFRESFCPLCSTPSQMGGWEVKQVWPSRRRTTVRDLLWCCYNVAQSAARGKQTTKSNSCRIILQLLFKIHLIYQELVAHQGIDASFACSIARTSGGM